MQTPIGINGVKSWPERLKFKLLPVLPLLVSLAAALCAIPVAEAADARLPIFDAHVHLSLIHI